MTPAAQNQVFHSWALEALAQYPLGKVSLRFLGHSDNLTFRVDEENGSVYLLRLHRPALNYWIGMRQLPEAIASELAWLEALAMEGGFTVQRPVHTRRGDMVALVDAGGKHPLPATLLTWLEGDHFSPGAPEAVLQVERFGELVARLHNFSQGWPIPQGFDRPRYDYDHFHRIFARLLRGVDLGVFSEEVSWILRSACQAIQNEILQLPADPAYWGIIHADLHVGNFLVQGQEIIPIDFSFCGAGHYLFDISVCLGGGLSATLLRPAFVKGYRSLRELPESEMRALAAYTLAGRLSYYAYQIDNPAERAWLQRRIPEVAEKDCSQFLDLY